MPENMVFKQVIGVGLNEAELSKNLQLVSLSTSPPFKVRDLNKNPSLEFLPDSSFDYVLNVVSVDYLIQPKKVFSEIFRVLKPGGLAINSFSNRCFPTKAVDLWLRNIDRPDNLCKIVASYFSSSRFTMIQAFDLSPNHGYSDPLYIVQARKPLLTIANNNDANL